MESLGNEKALTALKGFKEIEKISVGDSKEIVYESQDNKYGADRIQWRGPITEIDGKIWPNGEGYLYDKQKGAWKEIEIYSRKINDDLYIGEWQNDKSEGWGIIIYKNGDYYEGGFKNNKREGKGILKCADGDFYEGDWKNDKAEGLGKYIWADGDFYEGEFKNDKAEGLGKHIWADGDFYEGEWKGGEREGKGKFTLPKDGIIFEGNYENNIAINLLKIEITDSSNKCHIITKEGDKYFYQKGEGKQEIDIDNEKRLESVLLQFGNVISNRGSVTKTTEELSKFIKDESIDKEVSSLHIIQIPEHSFTMLFENGNAYCFDNGWLKNSSMKEWHDSIIKENSKYIELPHEYNLRFKLEDTTQIDIKLNKNTNQYCCRHQANVTFEKITELNSELKENESLYDKFNEYLKSELDEKPKDLIRVNSRKSLLLNTKNIELPSIK